MNQPSALALLVASCRFSVFQYFLCTGLFSGILLLVRPSLPLLLLPNQHELVRSTPLFLRTDFASWSQPSRMLWLLTAGV